MIINSIVIVIIILIVIVVTIVIIIIIIVMIVIIGRYGLQIPLDDSDDSIAKAILSTQNIFKLAFRRQWENHACNVEGCSQFLVSDGGMKIQR